jgi:hypothetical protein
MKNNRLALFAAPLLLGACAHAPALNPSRAAPEEMAADGAADFDVKDLAASRARAVQDAERNAVSRAAALYLDAGALAEKQQALESGLLKNPQLYVAKYKLLSAGQDGSVYRVRLAAWVYLGRISSDLKNLNISGPSVLGPRAALVARGAPAPEFADAFRGTFSRRSSVSLEDFAFTRDPAAAAGPEAALLDAAALSGADLLIEVSASASASGAGITAGFYPSKADASAKIYDASSGSQLAEFSVQADGIDSTQAGSFSKALASAGELLAQQAAAKADKLAKPDTVLTLKFFGLDGVDTLEKLKAQLSRLDVKALRLESYASGDAVFQAVPRNTPDPQEFASAVLRVDALGLQLEGTSPQEADFSLLR